MKLNKEMNGKELTIEIEGRVDTMTSPELDQMINDSAKNAESLVLDFANVEYISSAGLRVLLKAYKAMSKKSGMTIKNAGKDIREIFEITGFTDILNIV